MKISCGLAAWGSHVSYFFHFDSPLLSTSSPGLGTIVIVLRRVAFLNDHPFAYVDLKSRGFPERCIHAGWLTFPITNGLFVSISILICWYGSMISALLCRYLTWKMLHL